MEAGRYKAQSSFHVNCLLYRNAHLKRETRIEPLSIHFGNSTTQFAEKP